MILDAPSMTTWQSCRRRSVLEAEFRPIQWRPKALFDALLRKSIYALGTGADAASLASQARATFLSSAADPGLDLPQNHDPYRIAKAWCGMFDTLIRVIAATAPLVTKEPPAIALTSTVTWQPRAWVDDSGTLHRWLTVDQWDDEQIVRELHSWRTIGDLSAANAPMYLHVVEIGRMTKDHSSRTSPFLRAWQHPSMRNLQYRFRKPTGGVLASSWTPYYYSEVRDDADEWVERLMSESEHERVIHSLFVDAPKPAQSAEVLRQILVESISIREVQDEQRPYYSLPMTRTACDSFSPCPYQPVCYDQDPHVDPATIGLYQIRTRNMVDAGRPR